MKILITGERGFVGSNLLFSLWRNNKIESTSNFPIDYSNFNQVKDLFSAYQFDIVIHCAFKGGRRNDNDSLKDFYTNTEMVNNLLKFNKFYKLLINFDSGAVFDRRYSINNKKEFDRLDKTYIPDDFYGRAKFINNIELMKYKNVLNLRLFNVFGNGMEDSFIPTVIKKCLKNEPINIWNDHKFDTFYIEDLIKIVEYFIDNIPKNYLEINCCYKNKNTLSELAQEIKKLTYSITNIIIDEKGDKHYTGNGDRLNKLNLDLDELNTGLLKTIEYFKNGK